MTALTQRLLALALVGVLTASSIGAYAQQNRNRRTATPPAIPRTGGETGLLGIKLYDSGLKILNTFGSPDEIQAVTLGGAGIGPAAGPTGPTGAGGPPGGIPGGIPPNAPGGAQPPPVKNRPGAVGPSASGGPGSAARFAPVTNGLIGDPFGLGSTNLNQVMPEDEDARGGRGRFGGGPPGGIPGGPPPGFGGPPNAPGGAGFGGGAGGFGSSTTESAEFTRWIYNEPQVRLAFIVDKFNKVVQIEAIGLAGATATVNNRRVPVTTRRQISFGATFAQIMGRYNNPDGYDISGDSLVVRFLVREKVAFRLTRLQPNKPQQVTGIVIAAGKQ